MSEPVADALDEDRGESVLGNSPTRDHLPIGKVVIALIFQAIVMVVLGYGLWRWSGRESADFVRFAGRDAVLGLALGGALIAVAWAVFGLFPRIADALVRMQAKTYGFLGGRIGLPAIVAISLAAGIGEEALFRAGLQTYLSDWVGIPLAIALASAAFAAVHLARPVISLMLFVVGALFGIVYWQTGSLPAVMIGHALYDVWALRYLLDQFVRLGLAGAPLVNSTDDG